MEQKLKRPGGGLTVLDFSQDYPLRLKYTRYKFTEEERRFLSKEGQWLSDLIKKHIRANSPSRKHFADVFTNGAEPITECEKLWKRYLLALKEEEALRQGRIEEANKKSKKYPRMGAP